MMTSLTDTYVRHPTFIYHWEKVDQGVYLNLVIINYFDSRSPNKCYLKTSNINRTKSQNLNVSCLI